MTEPDIYWPQPLAERYEFVETVKTGRMATVVRAVDRTDDRQVALKVLHEHLVDEEPIRRRLGRELAAVRRLEHPAVVRVYDLIDEPEVVALTMEHVGGETARDRVERDGPMDWDEVRPILDSVLAALQEAHRKGIWHRDLNAEHVIVTDDDTGRVDGFGLARVDELVALTMHTRVLGALEAMAPERILGMDYDGRADLYSVGAVAWEMLVGHPPVDGSMREAFSRARSDSRSPVEELPADLPDEARYVLERSLVGDVGARFATPTQMRRALRGGYDEGMWRGWAARNTEFCPECESPVIDGISRCVVCDYEFRRLVQHPGDGDWMVRIVSPHEAFEPEVWFESNMEPKFLSEEQFDALMELLESHEDTEQLADRDWEYRWPPYVLLDELTREDARRVSSKLEARSIPHELTRQLPGAMQTAFQASGRSTGVMVGIALVLITGIFTAHVNVPVPDSLAAAGFLVFAATLFASQLLLVPIKRRLGSRKDIERHRGHAFMIPTEALQGRRQVSKTVVLPERTGRVLESLEDRTVRREVFELLVLAVAVAEDGDDDRIASISTLVDEVLEIGSTLDELAAETGRDRTVEIVERLRRLEVRIEACEDDEEAELLRRRRRESLEALEEHDRTVFDETMLKARLVRIRGVLLDLRSDVDVDRAADDEVILELDGGPEERLEELQTVLEADLEIQRVCETPAG